jgi:amidase
VLRCRKERFHDRPRQAVASPSAASCHETNTFQPQLTTYADFAETADRPPLTRGNAVLTGFDGIPLFGVREHARSFDTLSLIARSLEDVELFRAVLLKERAEPAPIVDGAALRIGFCRTPYWDQAEESTQRMLEEAAAKLAAAGAKVSEAELPPIFPQFADAVRNVGGFEFVQQLAFELNCYGEQLSKALLAGRVKDGLACNFQQYAASRIVMEECRRRVAEVFERHDVLLTPAAPGEAPEGHESTGNAIFNCLWTELHLPALTIPVFKGPHGLPMGSQLIGKWLDDRRLIAAAKWTLARLT